MPSITLSLSVENAPNPARKHFEKTNSWLSCFVIAIRVDFRQTFGGSISIMAQCVETQPMPNESSGKDLQIMCRSLLRQISPSWRNLRHKVS